MFNLRLFFVFLVFFFSIVKGYSQLTYSFKIESGGLKFIRNTIDYDVGPNWKGYKLQADNGFDFGIINSIGYKNKIFLGIGTDYLNFNGINGLAVYSDVDYLPFNTRLNLLTNIKFGYNHVWNQYENGTGNLMAEFSVGANYKIKNNLNIFIKTGTSLIQDASFTPVKIGIRFIK
ncbi:MAG: hypothetical protein RIR51_736 [Bacteroidota bacterium]